MIEILLQEKIVLIRKLNSLSQEQFSEILGISRQALSKWENGNSLPDTAMLVRIADFYGITLDELVRDEYDLPVSSVDSTLKERDEAIDQLRSVKKNYLGKICDVTMDSWRYRVLRNVQIIGSTNGFICFIKNNRLGYANIKRIENILMKSEAPFTMVDELKLGKCSVYTNKGTFFGGNTYLFSQIEEIKEDTLVLKTGEFISEINLSDISVIKMKEKIYE